MFKKIFLALLLSLAVASQAHAQKGTTIGGVNPAIVPFIGSVINISEFSPAANGTTDDTQPFVSALAACTTQGGGLVALGPHRYLIDSANITVPTGCEVYCPAPLLGNAAPTNYSATPFTVVVNPSFTINMATGSEWSGCPTIGKGVSTSSAWADYPSLTTRDTLNLVAAYGGSGFTVGSDVSIVNTFIGGFATGIASTAHTARLFLDHVNIDSTACVALNDAFDIPRYYTVHCFPFIVSGQPYSLAMPISGIANNGAGLYRVTLASASSVPATGDKVWVDNTIVGAKSANGRWTATVIDTTHVDLQASAGTGSTAITGSCASGFNIVTGLASMAGIGIGDTVTGTNIPASTTVQALSWQTNSIVISKNCSGAIAGGTLTFADAAYVSGGNLYLDGSQRSGIGLEWLNTTGAICTDCFVYGHSPENYHIGTGASGITFVGAGSDSNNNLGDPTTAHARMDGTSGGTQWTGGFFSTALCGGFVINSSAGANSPHTFSGFNALNGSQCPNFEFQSGAAIIGILGNPLNYNKWISVFGAMDSVVSGLNDLSSQYALQNTTAEGILHSSANNVQKANTPNGLTNGGSTEWVLGGSSTVCGAIGAVCDVGIGGAYYDTTTAVINLVNAGTQQINSANNRTQFTGSAISTYTINTPAIARAGSSQFIMVFDAAITTLTMGGVTSTGMPTTIAAFSKYSCYSNSAGTAWVCYAG